MNTEKSGSILSQRARILLEWVEKPESVLQKYALAKADEFDESHNPQGIIDLGVAENKLCEADLLERLGSDDCRDQLTGDCLYYYNWRGTPELRKALCRFFEHMIPTTGLKEDNFLISAGATFAIMYLAYALTDPGQNWLCPAPFYTGIQADIGYIPGVALRPFHLDFEGNLAERLAEEITKRGETRVVILVNPDNPSGRVYSLEEIREALLVCRRFDVSAVIDEVYLFSRHHGEGHPRQSVLATRDIPDPQRTFFIWSASKDFTISGYRCGAIYSWNESLNKLYGATANVVPCPAIVQKQLACVLQDLKWCARFIDKNERLLAERFEKACRDLENLGATVHKKSAAGFFVLANLCLCASITSVELEKAFADLAFYKHKVYILPGHMISCKSPGWFRLIFSVQQSAWDEAIKRLRVAIEEFRHQSVKGT